MITTFPYRRIVNKTEQISELSPLYITLHITSRPIPTHVHPPKLSLQLLYIVYTITLYKHCVKRIAATFINYA